MARLYRAEITEYPEGAYGWWNDFGEEFHETPWEPEGWKEYCEETWGEYREFWWPSTKRVYRSRSSAQKLVDLIEQWGAEAIVLESEPVWEPVTVANARRKRERDQARIAKLQAKIDAIKGEVEQ